MCLTLDVVILTETLSDESNKENNVIDGHIIEALYHTTKAGRRSGGNSVFVRENLSANAYS